MTKPLYVVSFRRRGVTMWLHKDGNPTLNRDSAYEYATYELAKRDADRCADVEMAVVYPVAGTT